MNELDIPNRLTLDDLKQRALAELEARREGGMIEGDEYERRVDLVMEARSYRELEPLIKEATRPVELAAEEQSGLSMIGDSSSVVAILGGSARKGPWDPPEKLTATAIMGGVELDFREARLLEGVVTRVEVFALMGGVSIKVPPDISVTSSGVGFMGGFTHVNQDAETHNSEPDPHAPRLHISGMAIMAGVEIKVVRERLRDRLRRRRS